MTSNCGSPLREHIELNKPMRYDKCGGPLSGLHAAVIENENF